MHKFSQKVIAGGMSLVLAVGLTPLPAFAQTGDLTVGASQLTTQADYKDIWDCSVDFLTTSTHVYNGAAFTPEPTVTYYGQKLVKGTDYTVTYQQWQEVTRTDEDGYTRTTMDYVDVTPKEVGEYRALITGKGAWEGTRSAYFDIVTGAGSWSNKDVFFPDMKNEFKYTGSAIKPTVTVKIGETTLKAGTDYTVKYQKEQYNEATDDDEYVDVNPVEPGTYYVTVTPAGKYATSDASPYHKTFYIVNTKMMDNAKVVWPNGDDVLYTGGNLAPKPYVYMDGKLLTYGKDYTIKYQQYKSVTKVVDGETEEVHEYVDVTPKAVGEYYAYILGKGAYQSTTNEPNYTRSFFEVWAGKSLSSKYASIELPNGDSFAYTGSKIEPKPVVTYRGVVLTAGKDYTLSYDNDNPYTVGGHRVVAKGIGSYRGSISTTYSIYSKTNFSDAEITMPNGDVRSYVYTGKAQKIKPTKIELYGKTLKEGKDYKVVYATNDYYGYYDDDDDYYYDGYYYHYGYDYETWVDEPKEIGQYRMYIIGKGAYAGDYTTRSFNIVEKNSLSAAIVSLPQTTYDYTGKKIKPEPVVILGGKTLKKGKDYTVTYYGEDVKGYDGYKKVSKPKNAGGYRIQIAPKGKKYIDTTSISYSIKPIELTSESVEVSLKKDVIPYSGKSKNPKVVVKYNGKKLKAENYRVSFPADATNLGDYVAYVTGRDNFTGVVALKYQVGPADAKIKKATPKAKAFTVTWAKVKKQNKGYQVRYSVNKDMSKAKTKTIKKVKTTKLTVKKLKAKTKYYVQVRTWTKVNGAKVYGNWSKTKAVKTK